MPNRNVDQLHSLARLDALLHDRSGGKRNTKFGDQSRLGGLAQLDMLTTCRATIALSNTRNRQIQVAPITLDFADYLQVKDTAGITSWGAKEAATERVVTGNRSTLEVVGLVGTVDTKNHYVAFSYCSKTHVVWVYEAIPGMYASWTATEGLEQYGLRLVHVIQSWYTRFTVECPAIKIQMATKAGLFSFGLEKVHLLTASVSGNATAARVATRQSTTLICSPDTTTCGSSSMPRMLGPMASNCCRTRLQRGFGLQQHLGCRRSGV